MSKLSALVLESHHPAQRQRFTNRTTIKEHGLTGIGTTAKRSVRQRRPSKFKYHVKAQTTVIRNEAWYGDDPPNLGPQFTAKQTAERGQRLIKLLLGAAKRSRKSGDKELAGKYRDLAKKLTACRPRARCGSLACPQCARAFQKAKVAAQETLISKLNRPKSTKKLVMTSVVPLALTFKPQELVGLDIRKRNRWLKDILRKAGFDRVMFGSADISWEKGYYQLHWHIAMWTADPKKLTARLTKLFPGKKPYDRPVVVSKTRDLGFLAYQNKGINLPDLLRRNQRHLAELLLLLARTEPLDLIFLMKLRLSTTRRRLVLKPIRG